MVSNAIIGYVRDSLKKGISLSEIEKSLIDQGVSLKDIGEAVSLVKSEPFVKNQNKLEIKNTKKLSYNVKIFLSIVFVIIVILAFLFILSNVSKPAKSIIKVDEFKIVEGIVINLSEASEIKFPLDGKDYVLLVFSLEKDSICFTGAINEKCIKIGEQKSYDLDNKSGNDLRIKLFSIKDKLAKVSIQGSGSLSCKENWVCTDWGICINGFKKRACADANSCEIKFNKPITQDICYNSSTQTYYYEPPVSIFDCGMSNDTYINSCFIEAARTCMNSKYLGDFVVELDPILFSSGINASTEMFSFMEIRGPDEPGTCAFYEEVLSYSQEYTSNYLQYLLENEEYTLELIEQAKLELNESAQTMVGLWNLCTYNQEGLVKMLEEYNENPFGDSGCEFIIQMEDPEYVIYSVECDYGNVSLIGECASGQN